ncbi:Carnitine O-acetyltransferase, partial [Hondaea fermentalgiana]
VWTSGRCKQGRVPAESVQLHSRNQHLSARPRQTRTETETETETETRGARAQRAEIERASGEKGKGAMTTPVKTFEMQDSLPTLPVPDLQETLQAYLTSVEPLLTAEEFAATKAKVEDFGKAGGDGEKLHKLLLERAAGIRPRDGPSKITPAEHPDGSAYPKSHWLEEWWETLAYLSDRTSLAVNINCFQTHFRAQPCADPVLRAAWVIKGAMDVKHLLDEGLVPPERAGKSVFCNSQYMRVFSTTRVPDAECDKLMTYTESDHVCVERRGNWYVLDKVAGKSVAELHAALIAIKDDADTKARGPGVGAFTGTDRTRWAKSREALCKLSKENAEAVETLESALFHVVLSEATPDSPSEAQRMGQCGNGEDIWFDKSGTHLIFQNGVTVSNLEHTSADAVVPGRVYTYIDEYVHVNAPEVGYAVTPENGFKEGLSNIPVTRNPVGYGEPSSSSLAPRKLEFALDASLREALQDAKTELAQIIDDNITVGLNFPEFGGKTISNTCKGVSTDSFLQMSLALAFYRDQKEMPVPYETATTRGFFHGRTETIRPQSMAMRDFLRAFDDASVPRQKVADLVRQAATHHRNYLRRCMGGKGIDRHLLGLRVLAGQQGLSPAIFADKAYAKSTCFTLSTSQMPWAVQDWPGFGAYDPAAYGTCYRFTDVDTIVATVTSRKRTGNGKDARRFAEVIKQAFRDMQSLLSGYPASKL